MADLPSSVLTNIFRFQSLFELKYGSMLVSKRWRDAASDPVLWKSVVAFISPSATSCLDLDGWIHGLMQKGITRYSFHKYCSRELIVKFCRVTGSKMKYLATCGCNSLRPVDFSDIVASSVNIETLDVSSCSGFAGFADYLHASSLQLCNLLPKLRYIDLGYTNFKRLANYPVQFLQGLDLKSLKHLGLSGIGFSDFDTQKELVNIISKLYNLKKLNLSFNDLSESFFICLDNDVMPNLEEINLTGCVNLNKGVMETIIKTRANLKSVVIKQAKDLKYIDVLCSISESTVSLNKLELNDNGATHLTDKLFIRLRQKMKFLCQTIFSSLRELNLSNCQLSHEFICQFCNHNVRRTIQVLQIASCGINDISLREICESLINLKELEISRNYRITDNGLLGVAKFDDSTNDDRGCGSDKETNGLSNLKKLQDLSMMYLSKISDEGLRSLSNLTSLRKFSVQGCRGLSAKMIRDVCKDFSLLRDLDIGRVPVDDETIESVTQSACYLQGLNLSGSEVTDKTLEILQAKCQCLRSLDVSGCEHITEAMIRKFIKGFGRQLFEFSSSVNIVFELAAQ